METLAVLLLMLLAGHVVVDVGAQTTVSTTEHSTTATATAVTGDVESASTTVRRGGMKVSVSASVSSKPKRDPPEPEPVEPAEPAFPVDFSSVESSLRTFIFQADLDGAAKVLQSRRVISLGRGLTYPAELDPLVLPSDWRNEDPDVVAFKALALSALQTQEAEKLATTVVLSFTPDCACSIENSTVSDNLIEEFTKDFMNKKELMEIVNADANTELVPDTFVRGLKCAGCSPVNSFACANCWPRKQCRKVRWCRR